MRFVDSLSVLYISMKTIEIFADGFIKFVMSSLAGCYCYTKCLLSNLATKNVTMLLTVCVTI